MSRRAAVLAAAVGLSTLTACGADDRGDSAPGPAPITAHPSPTTAAPSAQEPDRPARVVGVVARNLAVPWGLAFLPDGAAVVTERDSGRVLVIRDRRVIVAGNVPRHVEGEGGLLGVAVSPDFATDRQVFLYVTTTTDNRIVRATLRDDRLGDVRPILTGIPRGWNHDGGALRFGPDGFLYASTGETGQPMLAPDLDSLGGKILRITTDGEPAPGNPFDDSPVYSYGHRNVQGLAFDDDGRLWASEFGDQSWDELNLVEPGVNYGWPSVEGRGVERGLRNPVAVWKTSEASPSGLAYADGSLWMAGLRGQRLWEVPVDGTRAETPRDFLLGRYGRLRSVAVAPDGNLWVTTSNRDGRGEPAAVDDRILLVRP